MTDGVDAVVQPVQAADPQAVFDGIDVEPRIDELDPRDRSVLPSGKASERQIGRGVDET